MFTCKRAKEVWKSLGLFEMITSTLRLDKSGSENLAQILTDPSNRSLAFGQIGLKEIIAVGAWYIWWQRGEAVKGVKVAPAMNTTLDHRRCALPHPSILAVT